MTKYKVSLNDGPAEYVEAGGYAVDGAWVHFCNTNEKDEIAGVASYPAGRILSIKAPSQGDATGAAQMTIDTGGYPSSEAREAAEKSVAANLAYGLRL